MSRAVPTSSAGADVRNDPIPPLRDHLTDGASPARLPMRRLADAETRSRRARGRAQLPRRRQTRRGAGGV